ncbi:hypothetical protein [Microbispora sp. KK1-11]|uniref:hypothetical protein n=1 Tax=Microbispora sp. KK1-11 TaxID=2053005 RepID=UPI001C8D4DDB|nr:hypothetical protein [Microbispora sp. KK1-11]
MPAATARSRTCTRCEQPKSPEEFYPYSHGWCCDCYRAKALDRYHRLKPAAKRREGKAQTRTEKPCSDCKKTKPIEDFARNRAHRDGRDNLCKPCQKTRRQARAAEARAEMAGCGR